MITTKTIIGIILTLMGLIISEYRNKYWIIIFKMESKRFIERWIKPWFLMVLFFKLFVSHDEIVFNNTYHHRFHYIFNIIFLSLHF
jgi:hypothetical protein